MRLNERSILKKIWGLIVNNDITKYVGLLPFLIFVTLFLILPSANLFLGAFRDQNQQFTLDNIKVLLNPYIQKSFIISFQVSIITSLVGGVFGFLVAYSITLGKAPHWLRRFLTIFSGLAANFGGVPLAFMYISTLGRTGFVTALLKNICFGPPEARSCPFDLYENGFNLYSMSGLVLAYTYFLFPMMVLTITPALEGMKKEWREAAENLGANSFQYWTKVGIPVLWPSILASMILLFSSSFGAFATAQALTGGSIYLVPIVIGQQIRGDVLNNPNEGYALAFAMVVVMAIAILLYTVLQKKTVKWTSST